MSRSYKPVEGYSAQYGSRHDNTMVMSSESDRDVVHERQSTLLAVK
jgi:hypothetical protein